MLKRDLKAQFQCAIAELRENCCHFWWHMVTELHINPALGQGFTGNEA
jgi:hypothetical protein